MVVKDKQQPVFFSSGGIMGQGIRDYDWAKTPIGSISEWTQSLRFTVLNCISSNFPVAVYWGPEHVMLFNDAWYNYFDSKFPFDLGQNAPDAWKSLWVSLEGEIEKVLSGQQGNLKDFLMPSNEKEAGTEIRFDMLLMPVFGAGGKVEGVYNILTSSHLQGFNPNNSSAPDELEDYENKLAYRTALLEAQNEAIPDAILIVDTKGKMLSFNKHFVSLWNIPEEIIERKDDSAALEFAMTQLIDPEGFIERVNYYYKHTDLKAHEEVPFKDGRIIERYGNAVLGDDGRSYGWAWYFRDITGRKKAEEELKRFKHMSDNATEAFILMRADGSFAYLNDLALKKWGYTREESKNLRVSDVDPIYIDEVYKTAFSAAQKGNIPQFETIHKRKDGSTYTVEINMGGLTLEGAPHMFAIARDISERKKMEEIILESSEKIRNFILQAPVAMALYRGPDYIIEIVNKELLQIWNKPYEDVINKPVFDAMPEARNQGYEDLLHRVFTTGEKFTAYGIPLLLPRNGKQQTLYLNIVYEAYKEANGIISGIVEVVTDVTEQVTAVQKVKKSEQRFEAAIAAVQGIVWTNNAVGEMEGEQVGWSTLTGQSYNEYHGYGWAKAVHPDDAQPTIDAWNESVKNNSIFSFEHRVKLKNGEWGQFAIRSIPLLNEDGTIREWVGVHTDITEQRKAEAELKKTKEQLELTFTNVPAAIYLFGKKGEILFTNQKGAELMGYERSEEVLSEKDYTNLRKRTGETFEILTETRTPFPSDQSPTTITYKTCKTAEAIVLFVRKSDKKETWVLTRSSPLLDINGDLIMVITTSTDITIQKTSEQAIRQSEEKFRTLAETLPQLVWMRNKDGKMEYASKSWEEYSGIQNVSEAWKIMTHHEDWDPIMMVWDHAQAEGVPFTYEVRLKNKEGDYRWHYAVGEPVRDDSGQVIKWIGALTDIHIQKTFAEKLENLVAERTRELERSNEDLQQFAHVASHDLKEPVRKIVTFGNRLKKESSVSDKAKHYINKIESASLRMYNMIDGVLLYSQAGQGEHDFEKVDLNHIIQEVENDLELVIHETQAVIHNQHLPEIDGLPVLLHQLFYNLINNSLKFAREDVRPVIEIISEPVTLGTELKEFIQVKIKDNGIGFNQKYAENIFKTFFRINSKDKYEGSGLGLALCKKITERHNGVIYAEGNEISGAMIIIKLPIIQPGQSTIASIIV